MDDLFFETELRKRKLDSIMKEIKIQKKFFGEGDCISELTKDVLKDLDEILFYYFGKEFEEKRREFEELDMEDEVDEIDDKVFKMCEDFINEFTDEQLLKMYNNCSFTELEQKYMLNASISNKWKGISCYGNALRYAITEVLIRRKIIDTFGGSKLNSFNEIIERKLDRSRFRDTIQLYSTLFSQNPFGEKLESELQENLDKRVNEDFNFAINCGGYALKVDRCINPNYQDSFNKTVSGIINTFPFVRLIGDTKLQDDEYLVIYRAPKGKNTGHHFIRVDSDGQVREKDASGSPRIFNGWGNLDNNDIEEAVFAVKKDHKMFGYESEECVIKEGLNFEESVEEAIQ